MKAYERFLEYVAVWTTSDENSDTVPSAARELDLAKKLVEEMKGLGIEDARVDDKGYVYGSVPATPGCEDKAALGLIAHMDTAMDASGKDIKPQLIKNYDGGDVVLGTSGNVLSAAEFPHLAGLKGRTLITTDGTTLLGADDKAGIAEILTAVDEIIKEGLPHGKICIGFTPDEEIGRGSDHFDVEGFGADYAYICMMNYFFIKWWGPVGATYASFLGLALVFTLRAIDAHRMIGMQVHPGRAKP